LSSVIFLVTPGFDLASVYIYLTAQLGELGLASATTIKLIAIVAISLGILQFVAKKTGLDVSTKQGA
jgi:iron(III) transport system permease protein